MGAVFSSNTLKSTQQALYNDAKYVVKGHVDEYINLKGKLQGLQCSHNNGSKFITNTIEKIILKRLTLLNVKIHNINTDNLEHDINLLKTVIRVIIRK